MKINNPKTDGISIWVGGKVSNARHEPMFSKLAIPFLPNNPPRWPEVVDAVKNLVDVYAKNARKHERMGEWIERIGWPRFFKIAEHPLHQVPHRRLHPRRRDLQALRAAQALGETDDRAGESDDVANAMFELVKSTHGKKNLKAMDLTKAMIEQFGDGLRQEAQCKLAIRQLIDSGRCIYSYVGGSYVTLPPGQRVRLAARRAAGTAESTGAGSLPAPALGIEHPTERGMPKLKATRKKTAKKKTGPQRTEEMVERHAAVAGDRARGDRHLHQLMEKTDNLLVRQIMEIIRNDSVQHHRVQQFIIDSLTRTPVHLKPEDLARDLGRDREARRRLEREIDRAGQEAAQRLHRSSSRRRSSTT